MCWYILIKEAFMKRKAFSRSYFKQKKIICQVTSTAAFPSESFFVGKGKCTSECQWALCELFWRFHKQETENAIIFPINLNVFIVCTIEKRFSLVCRRLPSMACATAVFFDDPSRHLRSVPHTFECPKQQAHETGLGCDGKLISFGLYDRKSRNDSKCPFH